MGTAAIPPQLSTAHAKAAERLESIDGFAEIIGRDAALKDTLDTVITCSEYLDILARYPQLLEELIDSGRMHRPSEAGELDTLFRNATPENESENAFMRRIRLFRHRHHGAHRNAPASRRWNELVPRGY